jgi:transmembrane sensor
MDIPWELLTRYLSGVATSDDVDAVRRWCEQDPSHDALLQSLEAAWRAAAELPARHDASAAWARLRVRTGGRAASRAWAERRSERVVWQRAAIAAAIVAAGGLGLTFGPLRSIRPRTDAFHEYAAAAGERLAVTLTDGTQLSLAPASRLRVPIAYGKTTRTVELEGKAYFAVVHDPTHPFAVRARNALITDVGTHFLVDAYAGDSSVRVAVAEGRVRLADNASTPAPRAILESGDLATLDAQGRATVHSSADVASLTAWTTGRLRFHDDALAAVAAELGRWYALDISASNGLSGCRITLAGGDDAASSVLDAVAALCHARYARNGSRVRFFPDKGDESTP